MQIIYFLVIISALAVSAHDFSLFNMIDSHGSLLKIVEKIPATIWIILETAVMITVLIMARKRIDHEAVKLRSLWTALVVLCGFNGLLNWLDNGRDIPILDILTILSTIAFVVVMAVLGFKISRNFHGKIRSLGNIFTFAPGICLLSLLMVMAFLPDNFGELSRKTYDWGGDYIRIEESQTASTIAWTVVMIILSALAEIIPAIFCVEISRLPKEEYDTDAELNDNNSIDSDLSDNKTSGGNKNDDSGHCIAKSISGRRQSILIVALIASGLLVIGGIGTYYFIRHRSEVKMTEKETTNTDSIGFLEENYGNDEDRSAYAKSRKLELQASNGTSIPLSPQGGNTYDASNLVDGDTSTAWATDLRKQDFNDSPIFGPVIHIPGHTAIDYIVIYNGYCKNNDSFRNNTRPAWIQIYRPVPPDTGEPEASDILYEGLLSDTPRPQKLTVNKDFDFSIPSNDFIIKLSSLSDGRYYYGAKYKDLCISEIEFWGH